ncbi:alpha/beta hydrolase [Conexibacter woesei]|uniref:alpha/beta hydrolase n=1 Tax=Conexibacter woesei TaxID=191495 RepID=UPI0003F679B9|nr:alpha/beta hydrolase [Conexibacter woesei]
MDPRLHPQVRALLVAMGEVADVGDPLAEPSPAELAAERSAYLDSTLRLGGAAEPVSAVSDIVVPTRDGASLRARVFTPLHAPESSELLVWLHGGGWYVGDIETFDRVGRALANTSGAKVVLPEYRLAPEHRWPVPVHDAIDTVTWAQTHGAEQLSIDPASVSVGGDSAGGQLAVVAARHASLPLRAVLLVYPCLDPSLSSDAMQEFGDGPMLTRADVERCWGMYRTDAARDDDPDFAVLSASDWSDFPPTRVAVAELDPLRDDGLHLAERLPDAQTRVFDGMVHGCLRFGGVVDATHDMIAWLTAR